MTDPVAQGNAEPKARGLRRPKLTKREIWCIGLVAFALVAVWWCVTWPQVLKDPSGSFEREFYFLGFSSGRATALLTFLAAASIGAAYLLFARSLLFRISSRSWNWIVFVLVNLVGIVLALILVAQSLIGLLLFDLSGEYVRFEAEDGQAVLVNLSVSGMDDSTATVYTQVDAFHYVRQRGGMELGFWPDVGKDACDLTSQGELLILTCGDKVVEIDPQ